MLNCIALDDEPPGLKIIQSFCTDLPDLQLTQTFTKPNDALAYCKENPVDLLFLDINMPSILGTELYKLIPPHIMVIFTTAHSQYAVEGFNLQAIDYLLKPFSRERFVKAVDKAKEYYLYKKNEVKPSDDFFFIKADYTIVKVLYQDIEYIESLDDYVKIIQRNHKPIVTRMTMKKAMELLENKQFIRIHRSYIVPLAKISKVKNKSIFINETELPIGRNYENIVFDNIKIL